MSYFIFRIAEFTEEAKISKVSAIIVDSIQRANNTEI
jgi:hypothetical protein